MMSALTLLSPLMLLLVVGVPDAVPAASACPCPATTAPSDRVCGSDRLTYASLCELNCAKRKDSDLAVSYNGPCREAPLDPFSYSSARSRAWNPLSGRSDCCENCRQNCIRQGNFSDCQLTACAELGNQCLCQCRCWRNA